jgi:NSS family neurotransmitter:Na+ symporter
MKVSRFSRVGFILAASGSAVGLGNIWKFPYITGEYGGGAFVLIYLMAVLVSGISVLIAEMAIGKLSRSDGVSAFESLSHKSKGWKIAGFMIFNGILILGFYFVVIGWVLDYIFTISFNLPTDIDSAQKSFDTLLNASLGTQFFYFTISVIAVGLVVVRGIKSGIERFNNLFFPLIIVIFMGLLIYAMGFDSFDKSVSFLFTPDFSKITTEALMMAIGHAFFTLSLGMGAILTYSASLPKETNIVSSAIIITFIDTAIALIAGLVLFTFLFEFGSAPSKGPGLVFISIPSVFAQMGITGNIIALLFFISLAFAGLTSAVSLLEPAVLYFINRFSYSRVKSTTISLTIVYILGIAVILSLYDGSSEMFSFGGKSFFDLLDFTTSAILLPLSGLLMAIFVGFVIPKSQVKALLKYSMNDMLFSIWIFSLKYITPLALLVLLLRESGLI